MGMSFCLPCFEGSSADEKQPSPETCRRQRIEAAEQRKQMDESRGLKDPEGVKRKQQRKEDMERNAAKNDERGESGGLVWQVG